MLMACSHKVMVQPRSTPLFLPATEEHRVSGDVPEDEHGDRRLSLHPQTVVGSQGVLLY